MTRRVAFCLRDMWLGGVESVLVRTLSELARDKNFDITVVTYVDVAEPQWVDWFEHHPNINALCCILRACWERVCHGFSCGV